MNLFRKRVEHKVERVVHLKRTHSRCSLFAMCSCGKVHPIRSGRVRTDVTLHSNGQS